MAATEDGFLFQRADLLQSFLARQRWILRLVTSFRRQIGLVVSLGSSTQIFISFDILLLFFRTGKRLFSLVTIYLKLTEMSRKRTRRKSPPLTDRLKWN